MKIMTVAGLAALAVVALSTVGTKADGEGGGILQATLAEPDQKTREVSTEQLRRILADGSAIVLDARPRDEFEAGHIPGARHVDAPRAGRVAAIDW
jgi:Rhodanese-like domain